MARTAVTAQNSPNPFDLVALNVVEVAGDSANGNSTPATGREVIYARNTDASSHTLTIQGAPDPQGRSTNSVTTIPAAGVALTQVLPTNPAGWQQADGNIWFNVDSNLVKVAVIRR